MRAILVAVLFVAFPTLARGEEPAPPDPWTKTDYDEGNFYFERGEQWMTYHGMRDAWIYNRAMTWLERDDGPIVCYSNQSPLPLTGDRQVSRWYTGEANELTNTDAQFTHFVKHNAESTWDHAALPPLQFHIEQHPRAELEVSEATHPWQFIVVVKGRSGPPLYCSPWRQGPGKLSVDLLGLYRKKGYDHRFAEMNFFVAVWTPKPEEEATVVFNLRLVGGPVIIGSLPVIRTHRRAESQGVPIRAVVLDRQARPVDEKHVKVTASVGDKQLTLAPDAAGLWKAEVRGLPIGYHRAKLRATWNQGNNKPIDTTLDIHVTDGEYVGYDPALKMLTRNNGPLGPISGSYRGQAVFRGVGTPGERLLQGEADWQQAIADPQRPDYGFHFWESLTPAELEADYAYLQQCGWRLVHLCSAWLWWPRFDAAGRLSPFYAEQLFSVCQAARRHGLHVHLALSHYPLGCASPPYQQYLEAGFQPVPRGQRPSDYENPDSEFYKLFKNYLAQFASVFGDETAISSFTAAGEGEPNCGMLFVNTVHDTLKKHDPNHLFLCEPHHPINQDPNYYRHAGWTPLLGGMRNYDFDGSPEYRRDRPVAPSGVQYRLSAMGDIFLAEGAFYGFLGGNHQYMRPDQPMDTYRLCVRNQLYAGLAMRNPILLTWEERIVEDERVVFEQVRAAVDWSKPFQTPRLAIRIGPELVPPANRGPLLQYEEALARLPLDSMYLWEDEPAPEGVLHVIDAREPFVEPRLASAGGELPAAIEAHMPLQMPDGWSAVYSWSADSRTLLACLYRSSANGSGETATTEGGNYTYVDTRLSVEKDMLIDAWEVHCVKPGPIQLHIYRRLGDELLLVGRSDMVIMPKAGVNRFAIENPIDAKQGDLIGFYIPTPDTEIEADFGGSMLFVDGPNDSARTTPSQWQTEDRTARISVFSVRSRAEATVGSAPSSSPSTIMLQNCPAHRLRCRLFDLAAKNVIFDRSFEQSLTMDHPFEARHLFLLITEAD